MRIRRTDRGFAKAEFKDRYGLGCSIQKSSLATADCIWLGIDDPVPKIMIYGQGWVPVPMPPETMISGRMHLTRNMVKKLLPLLNHFVNTGDLPEPKKRRTSR